MKGTIFIIVLTVLTSIGLPAQGQYIYYSKCPGACEFDHCGAPLDTMYIFAICSSGENISGASFRLDVETNPDNLASLTPNDGVSIESGDLFQGLVLSWTPRDLNHYPVLTINWNQPLSIWEHWVRDAMFFQTNGDTLYVPDFPTYNGHFDCFWASFNCFPPDTVEVVIGSSFDVEIICSVTASGFTGTNIDINDECDWITDWNPKSVQWNYCSSCPWFDTRVIISGFVPLSTPGYSVSKSTIYPTNDPFMSDSTSFHFKAIPPVATKSSTWGEIKSRFGN